MSTSYLTLKIGDSIVWNIQYKQANNIAVNLTGFMIDINAQSKFNNKELFKITTTTTPNDNMYINMTNIVNGEFQVIIKDTSFFTKGDYFVDIEYTDQQGIKKSSKSVTLKVLDRL